MSKSETPLYPGNKTINGAGSGCGARLNRMYTADGLLSLALAGLVSVFIHEAWSFGVAAAWLTACLCADFWVIRVRARSATSSPPSSRETLISELAAALAWVTGAAVLFVSGERWAWTAGMCISTTVAIRIIFMGPQTPLHMFAALLPSAIYLLATIMIAGWIDLPFLGGVAATASALGVIASIANGARVMLGQRTRLEETLGHLRATTDRLEFAVEAAGEGYFEIDFADMIYRPNPRLAKSLGWPAGPKDLDRFHERLHDDCRSEALTNLQRCIDGDLRGWDQDLRILQADGEHRWMHLRARVLEQDGTRALIGILVDISERKAMEAELLKAKEAAEASSRSKSEFLANMSHEIRTPLNGVLGMAQALQADDLEDAQREKVTIILDSGKSLMALLNDVLDFSKIEAGKLEISPVPGDLLHTMRRVRQLFLPQAQEKGLDLSMRFDSNFPQRMTYDSVRVRQCVSNLVSNAIKFTASGRIEVALAARPAPQGGHVVSIEVSDTGIGMNPETQSRLFMAFTQADGAITRRFGGTGLGLAISRHLARLMGGDITVASHEGKGSTFRLTFHAGEAPALAASPSSKGEAGAAGASEGVIGSLRGRRVLLTDDNAVNRQVIRLFLAPHGCDIVEAANGKEALDALASSRFDILLLDVHMPVMDGKETIRRLRASRQDWAQLPVVALTADAMTGDREKYLNLGMTDYLSKPVDKRELVSKLLELLSPNRSISAAAVKAG